jgi:hypothetical protein
MFCDHYPRG